MSRLTDHLENDSGKKMFQLQIRDVVKDCQPFLKDILKPKHWMFMYSGRQMGRDMVERPVRKDRKPTDTNRQIHDDLDAEFTKQFGYPARSNSIFCTGDEGDAGEYGTKYMIFPQGNYKTLYSEDIGDLYVYLSRLAGSHSVQRDNGLMTRMENDCRDDMGRIDGHFEEYYDEVHADGGDRGSYRYEHDGVIVPVPKGTAEKDIKKYVQSKMDDPDDYWSLGLVWYPDQTYEEFYYTDYQRVLKEREVEVKKCAKERYDDAITDIVNSYTSGDVVAAIDSHSEIMLTCKKYWAINAEKDYLYQKTYSYFNTFGAKGHKTQQEYDDWWNNTLSKIIR